MRAAGLVVIVLLTPLALGCAGSPLPGRIAEFTGPTMGTTWSVKVVQGDRRLTPDESARIDARIRDDLGRITLLMSTWDAESELSRFNRSATTDPFPVSPETAEVFQWSFEMARVTDGALDVTVAPLLAAWGFGTRPQAGGAPDEETIERLRRETGMHQLELDPDGQWVRKTRPGIQVDFSAIAPGYAADRLAGTLAGVFGLSDFLVDIGGELVARGRNDQGDPWQVAIERPVRQGRPIARIVPLEEAAIATSGDYRNYREVAGQRVTHIVDPRTGRPVQHTLASATVVDEACVRADALATALMVLGPEDAMALSHRLDLAAMLLVRNASGGFDEWLSPRFETLMRTE